MDLNPSKPTLESVFFLFPTLLDGSIFYLHRDRSGPAMTLAIMTCRPTDIALETGSLLAYPRTPIPDEDRVGTHMRQEDDRVKFQSHQSIPSTFSGLFYVITYILG